MSNVFTKHGGGWPEAHVLGDGKLYRNDGSSATVCDQGDPWRGTCDTLKKTKSGNYWRQRFRYGSVGASDYYEAESLTVDQAKAMLMRLSPDKAIKEFNIQFEEA